MTVAPNPPAALAGRLARRLRLARLSLAWERLWPALWPAAAVAGIFLISALFNLWTRVPASLHVAALAAFAAGFALTLIQGLRGFRYPGEEEGLRRIETASGFTHRPLSALRDRPASGFGDDRSRALWRTHQSRAAQGAAAMRVGLPAPGMALLDPKGLRAAVLLVLVIGFGVAGGDTANRLARALTPDFSVATAATAPSLTLWLTPPPYTALAPMFLAADTVLNNDEPTLVTVPSGSSLLARVHGGDGAPRLEIDDTVTPFTAVDGANYELAATLTEGRRLKVIQDGRLLGDWALAVVIDQPPLIEFSQAPGRGPRAELQLDYIAEDDYGLVSIEATITRADDPAQSFVIPLTLSGDDVRSAEGASAQDLTPHPWAGLEVSIGLAASDSLGQRGASEPVVMRLPERIFNHPVARRLIEERRRLVLNPAMRTAVSAALDDISRKPDHFFDDFKVFLGLRAARMRLLYDISDEAIDGVVEMLWDIALTIEDGPVALSEQALRDAEQALLDALANGASDAEIDRLVDEMLDALDEFLNAMMEQADSQRDGEASLEEQLLQSIDREQIRDLVERVRELAKTGSAEAARELLEQLKAALENMRANLMSGENRQGDSEGQKALRDLEKLIGAQQKLLDETFRRAQGNSDGPTGSGGKQTEGKGQGTPGDGSGSQPGAGRQSGLRQDLADLMRRWGGTGQSIPLPLNRADRAMRDALQALTQGLPGQAVGPQTNALDEMRQGAQSLLQTMMEEMGRAPPRPGGMSGGLGNNIDPLGRGLLGRGYQDDSTTQIPTEADMQRSREILDELYRRAGEFQRPALERDYIKRLLKRF